jgi:hypothetical protein
VHIRYTVTVFLLIIYFSPGKAIGEEKPLWEIGAGMAFLQMPDYRGSDESRFYPLPYPHVVYRGDFFKVDENRITGQILKRTGSCWISVFSAPYRSTVTTMPPARGWMIWIRRLNWDRL